MEKLIFPMEIHPSLSVMSMWGGGGGGPLGSYHAYRFSRRSAMQSSGQIRHKNSRLAAHRVRVRAFYRRCRVA